MLNLSDVLNDIIELKKNIEISNQIEGEKQKTLIEALDVLEEIITFEQ